MGLEPPSTCSFFMGLLSFLMLKLPWTSITPFLWGVYLLVIKTPAAAFIKQKKVSDFPE